MACMVSFVEADRRRTWLSKRKRRRPYQRARARHGPFYARRLSIFSASVRVHGVNAVTIC